MATIQAQGVLIHEQGFVAGGVRVRGFDSLTRPGLRTGFGIHVNDGSMVASGDAPRVIRGYLSLNLRVNRTGAGVAVADANTSRRQYDSAVIKKAFAFTPYEASVFRKVLRSPGSFAQSQELLSKEGLREFGTLQQGTGIRHVRKTDLGNFINGVNRLRTDGPSLLNGQPTEASGVIKFHHGQSGEPVGPLAPQLQIALLEDDSYRATWTQPTDPDDGQIKGFIAEIDGQASDVGLVFEHAAPLALNATVHVRVRAYDDDGLLGDWSSLRTLANDRPPAASPFFSVTEDATGYLFSWAAAADDIGIAGYRIFEVVGEVRGPELTTALVAGTLYHHDGFEIAARSFELVSVDTRGQVSVGNPVEVVPLKTTTTTPAPTTTEAPTTTPAPTTTTRAPRPDQDPVPPPAPTTGRGPTMRLSWPNVADATRYDVYVNESLVLEDVLPGASGVTTARLRNIAPGAYDVVVVAKDEGGNFSPDSQVVRLVVTEDMIRKHRAGV